MIIMYQYTQTPSSPREPTQLPALVLSSIIVMLCIRLNARSHIKERSQGEHEHNSYRLTSLLSRKSTKKSVCDSRLSCAKREADIVRLSLQLARRPSESHGLSSNTVRLPLALSRMHTILTAHSSK